MASRAATDQFSAHYLSMSSFQAAIAALEAADFESAKEYLEEAGRDMFTELPETDAELSHVITKVFEVVQNADYPDDVKGVAKDMLCETIGSHPIDFTRRGFVKSTLQLAFNAAATFDEQADADDGMRPLPPLDLAMAVSSTMASTVPSQHFIPHFRDTVLERRSSQDWKRRVAMATLTHATVEALEDYWSFHVDELVDLVLALVRDENEQVAASGFVLVHAAESALGGLLTDMGGLEIGPEMVKRLESPSRRIFIAICRALSLLRRGELYIREQLISRVLPRILEVSNTPLVREDTALVGFCGFALGSIAETSPDIFRPFVDGALQFLVPYVTGEGGDLDQRIFVLSACGDIIMTLPPGDAVAHPHFRTIYRQMLDAWKSDSSDRSVVAVSLSSWVEQLGEDFGQELLREGVPRELVEVLRGTENVAEVVGMGRGDMSEDEEGEGEEDEDEVLRVEVRQDAVALLESCGELINVLLVHAPQTMKDLVPELSETIMAHVATCPIPDVRSIATAAMPAIVICEAKAAGYLHSAGRRGLLSAPATADRPGDLDRPIQEPLLSTARAVVGMLVRAVVEEESMQAAREALGALTKLVQAMGPRLAQDGLLEDVPDVITAAIRGATLSQFSAAEEAAEATGVGAGDAAAAAQVVDALCTEAFSSLSELAKQLGPAGATLLKQPVEAAVGWMQEERPSSALGMAVGHVAEIVQHLGSGVQGQLDKVVVATRRSLQTSDPINQRNAAFGLRCVLPLLPEEEGLKQVRELRPVLLAIATDTERALPTAENAASTLGHLHSHFKGEVSWWDVAQAMMGVFPVRGDRDEAGEIVKGLVQAVRSGLRDAADEHRAVLRSLLERVSFGLSESARLTPQATLTLLHDLMHVFGVHRPDVTVADHLHSSGFEDVVPEQLVRVLEKVKDIGEDATRQWILEQG